MPATSEQNGTTAAAAKPGEGAEPSPKKAKAQANVSAMDGSLASLMNDYDPEVQAVLKQIDQCQTDIDKLNERASDEILTVEHKYNQLRKPHFDARAQLIQKVDNFWLTTFVHHPQLSALLSEDDEEVLRHLVKLEVEEFEDIKSGYVIRLHFSANKWFGNSTLCKEFHMAGAEPSSKSTDVQWKSDDLNLVKLAEKKLEQQLSKKAGEKRPAGYQTRTFFTWFVDNEDASCDDIAEAIKDDLWPNPLQYYLISEDSLDADGLEDDDEDDDDDDEEEEGDDDAGEDEADDDDGEEDA